MFIFRDWHSSKRRWMSCAVGMGTLLACSYSTAQEITLTDSNIPAEEWVDPATPITLTFDRLPTEEEGQLAVLLDKTDLSALFQQKPVTVKLAILRMDRRYPPAVTN
ncbi:MAG: hypothetical protein R3F37_21040 [Candidatus Competibacteraceae bacterium]